MTHSVLTKGFLQLRPEADVQSGPSVETPCSAFYACIEPMYQGHCQK